MTGSIKMGPHVRAVRWTNRPEAWRPVAEALGGRSIGADADEQVYALGDGALVVRRTAGNPVTAIELGAVDAGAGQRVAGPDGMSLAIVTFADLKHQSEPEIAEYPASDPRPSPGAVSVCPLWMTADVSGAAAALRSAGLTVRLASDAGQWVDLLAPGGGLVAVHADVPPDPAIAPHTVLAFEAPDVTALAERFEQRGLRGDVVDESYGRSLRIDDPDGGIELWVNETMTDLYGYRRGGV